jgi:hypothetical protein
VQRAAGAVERGMQGHGPGVIVTPMSGEDHPTLRDMTCRTDKRMVLEAAYSARIVRDHVRQDQLSATGSTTHHSYTKSLERSAHPARGVYDLALAILW